MKNQALRGWEEIQGGKGATGGKGMKREGDLRNGGEKEFQQYFLWGCHVMTRSLLGLAIVSPVLLAQAAVTSGLCYYHQFRRVGTPTSSPLEETMTKINDSGIIITEIRLVVATGRR